VTAPAPDPPATLHRVEHNGRQWAIAGDDAARSVLRWNGKRWETMASGVYRGRWMWDSDAADVRIRRVRYKLMREGQLFRSKCRGAGVPMG
jgi:hypothetical protein